MTTRLLHLDSSILGPNSVSRTLSASVVKHLQAAHPALEVTYRDLAANPVPHLTGAYLASDRFGAPATPEMQAEIDAGHALIDEFLAADVVVVGVAFYNFTISTQLKAWIDRIAVAGKTFKYSEQGAVGLAGGKRVILAIARGGFYGPGTPAQSLEHAETYLRGVFAFVGIPQVEVVSAEGLAIGPEARQASLTQAEAAIAGLPA